MFTQTIQKIYKIGATILVRQDIAGWHQFVVLPVWHLMLNVKHAIGKRW